jgi:UDP-N-acetyl-D-galactosamine dehydrogenase
MQLIDGQIKISIIGVGYVGLPLSILLSTKYDVICFDKDKSRIKELQNGIDKTNEIHSDDLHKLSNILFSTSESDLLDSNVYIVAVPTPIDKHKIPDLNPLISATSIIGNVLKVGDTVIFESTVYPGATEDDCVPVLEKISGLKLNKDFFVGYSPERVNPGDKTRKLSDITKITSGSNPSTASFVDELYSSVISAGTFKTSSIKVAESAKVIENIQRDVNISLINEFHKIFTNMGIDTNEVIDAASTKWNFMSLRPGLVGGHCISIDPYYLMHKSVQQGFIADLIRTGREINDSMPHFLAYDFLQQVIERKMNPVDLKVLILGFSFKENCPDIRNTKVINLYEHLSKFKFNVSIYDPIADKEEVKDTYGINLISDSEINNFEVALLAVRHNEILKYLDKFNFIYTFNGKV